MVSNVFINLAVRDLARTKAFFEALGFAFNPQFTDDNAACLVLGPSSYAMLLHEPFFKTFISNELVDARTHTEALIAIQLESRAAVDALMTAVLAHGGTEPRPPQDHGFMYQRTFHDLDGHHWEPFWIDPAGPPQA